MDGMEPRNKALDDELHENVNLIGLSIAFKIQIQRSNPGRRNQLQRKKKSTSKRILHIIGIFICINSVRLRIMTA